MPHILKPGVMAEVKALWHPVYVADGGGSRISTWNEPGGDLMHAVECSRQCEKDSRNQVEVVDEPQLQRSHTVSKQVRQIRQQPAPECTGNA